MKKKFLMLSFYSILNQRSNINLFFYIAKNSKDRQFIYNKLRHILIYYKSFTNYKDTLFYIDKLEDDTYLEDTLNYIVNSPFCKIVRYLNGNIEQIYKKYKIDFNYQTVDRYVYNYIPYTIERIGEIFPDPFSVMRQKYMIKDELMDKRFNNDRMKYISRTLFIENI